ncbi:hypothetical protein [Nocardioides dongxiaopingii]|uniref:hypothetical protein n=1 Tax=Nocardioides dongxiaopingii TaxID=2576036 RepID=UPI001484DD45|nr:hypothetical protein [Nocardioides dongxiaopingii]
MTTSRRTTARSLLLAVATAAAAAACWWASMGWDHEYYTDPATGYAAGPYRPWQVAVCVLGLLAVAAVAFWLLHPVVAGLAMTLGFTVSFASSALPDDDTGLAMVGVVMVLFAMALASVLVGLVATAARGRRHPAGG